jgi:hypothetical protein
LYEAVRRLRNGKEWRMNIEWEGMDRWEVVEGMFAEEVVIRKDKWFCRSSRSEWLYPLDHSRPRLKTGMS